MRMTIAASIATISTTRSSAGGTGCRLKSRARRATRSITGSRRMGSSPTESLTAARWSRRQSRIAGAGRAGSLARRAARARRRARQRSPVGPSIARQAPPERGPGCTCQPCQCVARRLSGASVARLVWRDGGPPGAGAWRAECVSGRIPPRRRSWRRWTWSPSLAAGLVERRVLRHNPSQRMRC